MKVDGSASETQCGRLCSASHILIAEYEANGALLTRHSCVTRGVDSPPSLRNASLPMRAAVDASRQAGQWGSARNMMDLDRQVYHVLTRSCLYLVLTCMYIVANQGLGVGAVLGSTSEQQPKHIHPKYMTHAASALLSHTESHTESHQYAPTHARNQEHAGHVPVAPALTRVIGLQVATFSGLFRSATAGSAVTAFKYPHHNRELTGLKTLAA